MARNILVLNLYNDYKPYVWYICCLMALWNMKENRCLKCSLRCLLNLSPAYLDLENIRSVLDTHFNHFWPHPYPFWVKIQLWKKKFLKKEYWYIIRILRSLEEWKTKSFLGFPGVFQQTSRWFLCNFVQPKKNLRSFAFRKRYSLICTTLEKWM